MRACLEPSNVIWCSVERKFAVLTGETDVGLLEDEAAAFRYIEKAETKRTDETQAKRDEQKAELDTVMLPRRCLPGQSAAASRDQPKTSGGKRQIRTPWRPSRASGRKSETVNGIPSKASNPAGSSVLWHSSLHLDRGVIAFRCARTRLATRVWTRNRLFIHTDFACLDRIVLVLITFVK